MFYLTPDMFFMKLLSNLVQQVVLVALHPMEFEQFERLIDQSVLSELRNSAIDYAISTLVQRRSFQTFDDCFHYIFALSVHQCSKDDFESLTFPAIASRLEQAGKCLCLELVLSESKWSHVVVFEDVRLQGAEVLSLDEQFCKFRFYSHSVEMCNKLLTNVSLAPLTHFSSTKILICTYLEQLVEWLLQANPKQTRRQSMDSTSFDRVISYGPEASAKQTPSMVVKRKVSLVQHVPFFNSAMPYRDCAPHCVDLALVSGPFLAKIALRTFLKH